MALYNQQYEISLSMVDFATNFVGKMWPVATGWNWGTYVSHQSNS